MKQIEVTVNDKILLIKKLPLGKYAELLKAFEQLPQYAEKWSGTVDETIKNLPYLVQNCADDLFRVINIVTDAPVDEIKNEWGLSDLTVVIEAVYETNEYASVYNRIKKMTARPNPVGDPQKSPSTNGLPA